MRKQTMYKRLVEFHLFWLNFVDDFDNIIKIAKPIHSSHYWPIKGELSLQHEMISESSKEAVLRVAKKVIVSPYKNEVARQLAEEMRNGVEKNKQRGVAPTTTKNSGSVRLRKNGGVSLSSKSRSRIANSKKN